MEKLFATKDEKMKFYSQIEISKNIWKFLDELSDMLYCESWMIDDHYQGKIKNNDYFSFEKDGVHLIIIMTEERAHLVILGLQDNNKIKKFLFENYSFESIN